MTETLTDFDEFLGTLDLAKAVEDRFLEHPDIRYFLERNPGHAAGDELCCLGRIDLALWSSYMLKLVRRHLLPRMGKDDSTP